MLDLSSRCRAWVLALGLGPTALACDPSLPPEIPDPEPVVRVPAPVGEVEGDASRNLLQSYLERDPVLATPSLSKSRKVPLTWEQESRIWKLPYQSKRIVAALIIAVAHDRLENLRFLLTPDARWGWPDLRRPASRPVFDGDRGEAFFGALRSAASRLPGGAKWSSVVVPPGVEMLHMTGAEPMWVHYQHGRELIVIELVIYEGTVRIAYVGLFEQLPAEPPVVTGYGPPLRPVPMLRPPPEASVSGFGSDEAPGSLPSPG
ncbi:MAG: hypothetical protein AB1Z98_38390 [Nannocystaceae bacterium]